MLGLPISRLPSAHRVGPATRAQSVQCWAGRFAVQPATIPAAWTRPRPWVGSCRPRHTRLPLCSCSCTAAILSYCLSHHHSKVNHSIHLWVHKYICKHYYLHQTPSMVTAYLCFQNLLCSTLLNLCLLLSTSICWHYSSVMTWAILKAQSDSCNYSRLYITFSFRTRI